MAHSILNVALNYGHILKQLKLLSALMTWVNVLNINEVVPGGQKYKPTFINSGVCVAIAKTFNYNCAVP
jgi:hypothetical protein